MKGQTDPVTKTGHPGKFWAAVVGHAFNNAFLTSLVPILLIVLGTDILPLKWMVVVTGLSFTATFAISYWVLGRREKVVPITQAITN